MDLVRSAIEVILGPFDALLSAVPLQHARWFALALLLIPALATLRAPREFVFRGAPDQKPWRDLRIWVWVVILPYVLIYALAP